MNDFWQRAQIGNGEIKDGETRYVMFRADVIAAMINDLPAGVKQQVLSSFRSAVQKNGGRSLQNYLGMVGGDHGALLDMLVSTAAALGWGEWHFDFVENHLTLQVNNSPFAEFTSEANNGCCAPILGMFSALAETLLNGAQVKEVSCVSLGADHCRFEASPT